MQLDYRDARPIYVQIMDTLREQITAGVLQRGERLPSVRELAAELSINPNTIQRAYRQLEVEGWIVTVPGKGCFVCGDAAALEREKQRLEKVLAETAAALEALGVSREKMAAMIRKEEHSHA